MTVTKSKMATFNLRRLQQPLLEPSTPPLSVDLGASLKMYENIVVGVNEASIGYLKMTSRIRNGAKNPNPNLTSFTHSPSKIPLKIETIETGLVRS